MFAVILLVLFVNFSNVYSNESSNDNLIEDELNENILFLDKSLTTGLLNPPLNETINDLNEILVQLIKRIENNPILFNIPEFLRNFMNLMKKINEIVEKSAKSAKINTKVKEGLMKLDFLVSKLNVLMKTYAKIENIKPIEKTNDTSIPESFDYWSIIWKTINKIETQLSKTTELVRNTQTNNHGLNSDITRNQLIFEVLSQIRNKIATNDTLQKISNERSVGMNQIMAQVMARVDSLTTTTRMPIVSRPPPNTGLIGTIFSRIRGILTNQATRPTLPPTATTVAMTSYRRDIDAMVKQIMEELFSDNSLDLLTEKSAQPNFV